MSKYIEIDEYQAWTIEVAEYPEAGEGTEKELAYLSLGLVGEAGEVANKIKKILRGDFEISSDIKPNIAKELGDVMWYVARLADALDEDLSFILFWNQLKLKRRKDKKLIKGSGDDR